MNEYDEDYYYMENDFMKALKLHYKGKRLSMIIFLPHKTGLLSKLENQLSAGNFTTWNSSLNSKDIKHVKIPKFNIL